MQTHMFLSVCLPVCLPACLPVCLSACLPVCLSACLHVCMSACLHVCMSACLHVCMSACLHVCMSACLHVCMSVFVSLSTFTFLATFSPHFHVRTHIVAKIGDLRTNQRFGMSGSLRFYSSQPHSCVRPPPNFAFADGSVKCRWSGRGS